MKLFVRVLAVCFILTSSAFSQGLSNSDPVAARTSAIDYETFHYNDTRDTMTRQIRERAFIVKLTNLFNF